MKLLKHAGLLTQVCRSQRAADRLLDLPTLRTAEYLPLAHAATAPASANNASQDRDWLRWLASGSVLVAAYANSQAQAKELDAAASTSETSSQHSARGGEASTSEAAAQPEQPIGNEHTAKWKLYTTQGRKLVAQKKLVEAEKYLKQALHEAKLGFGEADPHVAGAFNNLAELHRLKQEVPEAEELYQQCVELMRQCFGNADLRVGAAVHNMAGLYLSSKPPDFTKAEVLLREALNVKRAAVGEKHAEYVQSLVALAELKRRQGNSPDALLLFQEAAQVLQHQDPTFSASNVMQYIQLATVLIQHQQYAEAEALLTQLMLHVESVKGDTHPDVGLVCQEMALLMQRTKRLPQARDLLQRGLDLRAERYRNPKHPGLVDPLLALAAVELRQDDTASWQRAFNIAGRARELSQANVNILQEQPQASSSGSWFRSRPAPAAMPAQHTAKVNLSYLMSSAKLATSQRLIALAESKLGRPEEAEQTMITAMKVFKDAQLVKGLKTLYQDADEDLDSEMGSALSVTVKTSVAKRVVESYAACAIQFAALLKQRPAEEGSDAAAVSNGAQVMHARGVAAHAACKGDVLAAKWMPP